MRKLLLPLLLLISTCVHAQTDSLRMHSTLYGFGHANVYDSYLSPYSYKGMEARIIRQTQRPTKLWNGHIAYQTMVDGHFQYVKNPAKNVKEYGGGIRYSNAWIYTAPFRPIGPSPITGRLRNQWTWGAGLSPSIYLGGIYNSRNGNNPAQAKTDIMLDAKGQLGYTFHVKGKPWLVRYELAVPLLGMAFSPNYGQTYYEIFSEGVYDHNVVFANFVNMPSMRHLLTIDIPIGHNYLRLGWSGEFMQARFNGLHYHSYSNDFMIGFTKYFKRITQPSTRKGR